MCEITRSHVRPDPEPALMDLPTDGYALQDGSLIPGWTLADIVAGLRTFRAYEDRYRALPDGVSEEDAFAHALAAAIASRERREGEIEAATKRHLAASREMAALLDLADARNRTRRHLARHA